jgi:uroporphyrinogen decarboxylase
MPPITPLANFRKLVTGPHADWIPFTLDVGAIPGFTAPALAKFHSATGAEQPDEFFDYDFRIVSLKTRFAGENPAALHDAVAPGTTFDEWGIGHWAGGAAGTYEKIYPPLARAEGVRDVEALPVPQIEVERPVAEVEACHVRGYPVWGYAGSVYEWSWWLRGMQAFMTDLAANEAVAEAILRKVAGYTASLALETARMGVDILCFYDDAGMQSGMQISPKMWRRFVKPRWREILDLLRRSYPDCTFFLHSCGKIEAIIPDIIEVGFHILHPVQPECMDFEKIRATFGHDLILCACISAQQMFPFGTPGDVRAWVDRAKERYASDNRTILCPSNRIQPETPWENVVAFAAAAKSRAWGQVESRLQVPPATAAN